MFWCTESWSWHWLAVLAVGVGCGSGNSSEKCGAIGLECTAMANNDCNRCLGSCCCGVTMACLNDSSCMSLTGCMNNCSPSDNVCMNNCMTSYPAGESLLVNFGACMDANCSSVCQ